MHDPTKETIRRAAIAGLGAMSGLKAAHIPAKVAARVPGIGPVLGLLVLAGGALTGAAQAVRQSDS